jgi:hypothetical protein
MNWEHVVGDVCLFGILLIGLWTMLRWGWGLLVRDWQRWMRARIARRVDALKPYLGKLVRDVNTGGVGLCTGLGHKEHPRLGCLRAAPVVQVVVCAACARALREAENPFRAMVAMSAACYSGHVRVIDACDITIAPERDAAQFREEGRHGE